MKKDNILVSISCIAYNQKDYIRDCLEGIVKQKTTFPFEVLVHDDASTDGTADIIREYEKMYPEIIKPIYQTENQYSKGVKIGHTYQLPRAKGKYYAVCEGDDYWTDQEKLQLQVEYMEEHPECSLTCHNSIRLFCDSGMQKVENPYEQEGIVDPAEVIYHKPDCWPATASLICKTEDRRKMPVFVDNVPIGDYPLRMYCAGIGNVYYFDRVMSVYRFGSLASWTKSLTSEQNTLLATKMIEWLTKYNAFTQYQYAEPVEMAVQRYKGAIAYASRDYRALVENTEIRKNKKKWMIYKLGCYMPHIVSGLIELHSRRKKHGH
ncbi:MAG: glycosyltransferase family A protein [Clostridia bacterium]|nr:glycosyltransferase family A protein [Clostridia bacterium]